MSTREPAPASRSGFVVALSWIAVYGAVVVIVTWPLARGATSHLPDPVALVGAPGWAYASDILYVTWALAWDAHALPQVLTQGARGLFDANIFFPASHTLAYSEHFLGHAPVAVPVFAASRNPVLTFNVVLLSSLLLCALTMHALAWHWTRSHLAAFAAALVYAVGPWRLQPSFSLQVVGAGYLPLVPLFLVRWGAARRQRDLAGLAMAVLLQTMCSYYLGYGAMTVLAVCVVVLLASGGLDARAALVALGAVAVALVPAVVVSLPYLHLAGAGALAPGGDNLGVAWLSRFRLAQYAPGSPGFPGWIALALGGAGAVLRPRDRRAWCICLGLVAAGVLLAAGPHVVWGAHRVTLPYGWLVRWVPGFGSMRFPARFVSVAVLGFAGLVAMGTAGLAGAARGRAPGSVAARSRWTITAALLVALCLESTTMAHVPIRSVPTGPRRLYDTLAAQPGDGAVLELPVGGGADPRGFYREALHMVRSAAHWKPLVNGYSGTAPPTFHFLTDVARRLPERDALEDLVDLVDVRWIVVHGASSRPRWDALAAAGLVRRLGTEGDDTLYAVETAPRPGHDLRAAVRRAVLTPSDTTLTGTPRRALSAETLAADWEVVAGRPMPLAGYPVPVAVTVRNRGSATWPGWGVRPAGLVVVELHWLAGDGRGVPGRGDTLVRLPRDVGPGESATVHALLWAPKEPGEYWLSVRLQQQPPHPSVGPAHRQPVRVVAPPGRSG